jgi:hypothetical protein
MPSDIGAVCRLSAIRLPACESRGFIGRGLLELPITGTSGACHCVIGSIAGSAEGSIGAGAKGAACGCGASILTGIELAAGDGFIVCGAVRCGLGSTLAEGASGDSADLRDEAGSNLELESLDLDCGGAGAVGSAANGGGAIGALRSLDAGETSGAEVAAKGAVPSWCADGDAVASDGEAYATGTASVGVENGAEA